MNCNFLKYLLIGLFFYSPYLFAADAIIDTNTQLPQPINPLHIGGTIIVKSNKENALVIINNVELGKTPFCRYGFQPGFYNIEIKHDECRPYSKMVLIEKNDTSLIDVQLEPINRVQESATTIDSSGTQEETIDRDESPMKPSSNTLDPKNSFLSTFSGTFDISCNVANANIYINKLNTGKAPLIRTGLTPGYYEVEIKKDGYKPFYQMFKITGNDTITIHTELISVLSRLIVKSTPANARVFLNNTLIGITPLDSSQINPAIYNLRIELPNYVPVKRTITLTPSVTDSVSVTLTTIAFRDSVRKVRAYQSKIARRILFGLCTAGSTIGIISYNLKASGNLVHEREAWNQYMKPDLSGYEYDQRFKYYKTIASRTDRYIRCRNAFTIISLISAAGLTISIPF